MRRFFKIALFSLLAVVAAFAIWCFVPPATHSIAAADFPWKTGMTEAEVDSTARHLLAQMSLDEKIEQLHGEGNWLTLLKFAARWKMLGLGRSATYSGYNARLGIPPLAASDGPRGLGIGTATCFPVTMARGATWNPVLERRVGAAMGIEARASGVNYHLGCCINLLRHPAWGRAQETYGEDPELLGTMGAAWVQGIQQHNVMACVKHFALNSSENNRFNVNVLVDERTLHEVYLPHFKKCVEAGAASVMSAYNQVNGAYCGHSRPLLTDVLRQDWGLKGFVSSDWVFGIHAAAPAANAGMDVEMPFGMHYGQLAAAVRSGQVSQATLDAMVLWVLRTKLWYITRPDPQAYAPDMVASAEHGALAREVAEQSMVLLKNEGNLLPLDLTKLKKLAIIGPLATADNMGDRGSSEVKPPAVVTLLDGIRAAIGSTVEIVYEPGVNSKKAAEAAAGADAVLLIVGYRHNDEGENLNPFRKPTNTPKWSEGGDRFFLRLREDDEVRIRAVSSANSRMAVVIFGGSAIVMDAWQAEVPSILMAWYPGMEGGTALANVLLGKVNPCGKLPFTIAHSEADYPQFDSMADTITYGPYHGYTLLDKKGRSAAFAFGFGLSYSTFRCDGPLLRRSTLDPADTLRLTANVINTGSRAGAEVVQLYIGFEKNGPVERPKKLLRGFEKIELQPGETRSVAFALPMRELAWYDPKTKSWKVEPGAYTALTGTSSREEDLQGVGFSLTPNPSPKRRGE